MVTESRESEVLSQLRDAHAASSLTAERASVVLAEAKTRSVSTPGAARPRFGVRFAMPAAVAVAIVSLATGALVLGEWLGDPSRDLPSAGFVIERALASLETSIPPGHIRVSRYRTEVFSDGEGSTITDTTVYVSPDGRIRSEHDGGLGRVITTFDGTHTVSVTRGDGIPSVEILPHGSKAIHVLVPSALPCQSCHATHYRDGSYELIGAMPADVTANTLGDVVAAVIRPMLDNGMFDDVERKDTPEGEVFVLVTVESDEVGVGVSEGAPLTEVRSEIWVSADTYSVVRSETQAWRTTPDGTRALTSRRTLEYEPDTSMPATDAGDAFFAQQLPDSAFVLLGSVSVEDADHWDLTPLYWLGPEAPDPAGGGAIAPGGGADGHWFLERPRSFDGAVPEREPAYPGGTEARIEYANGPNVRLSVVTMARMPEEEIRALFSGVWRLSESVYEGTPILTAGSGYTESVFVQFPDATVRLEFDDASDTERVIELIPLLRRAN